MTESLQSMSVKETKEALSAIIALANAGDAAAKDGKIDFNDIGLLIGLIPKIQPAIDGVKSIPSELKDLSSEEAEELVAFVTGELTVGNGKAVVIIEKGFKTMQAVAELVKAIRS